MSYFTDDPVRDAKYHIDDRPVIARCEMCRCDICGSARGYYGDDHYVFDGGIVICTDCKDDYINENFLVRGE